MCLNVGSPPENRTVGSAGLRRDLRNWALVGPGAKPMYSHRRIEPSGRGLSW